jgi:hypothetical protein
MDASAAMFAAVGGGGPRMGGSGALAMTREMVALSAYVNKIWASYSLSLHLLMASIDSGGSLGSSGGSTSGVTQQ